MRRRIEWPLAKAAIEKIRIDGRYAPDIIAEALLRLKKIGNVETGNYEDTWRVSEGDNLICQRNAPW